MAASGRKVTSIIQIRKYLIGRAHDKTDITLSDGTISRIHAELQYTTHNFLLKDLGSSNGTFVNGGQLQPQTATEIKIGDMISLGECKNYLAIKDRASSREAYKEHRTSNSSEGRRHRDRSHRSYRSHQ